MDWNDFTLAVRKRISPIRFGVLLDDEGNERHFNASLQHSAEGMVTEAAEFLDTQKRWKYYGDPLDRVHMIEELGDLLFYAANAMREIGVSLEQVLDSNDAKLERRYGDSFSSERAIKRQLADEYHTLNAALQCCPSPYDGVVDDVVFRNGDATPPVVDDNVEAPQPAAAPLECELVCSQCRADLSHESFVTSPTSGQLYCGMSCAIQSGEFSWQGGWANG